MTVASVVASNAAAQAIAAQANKPIPVADAPHDGDRDDVGAAVAPGIGKLVDKKA